MGCSRWSISCKKQQAFNPAGLLGRSIKRRRKSQMFEPQLQNLLLSRQLNSEFRDFHPILSSLRLPKKIRKKYGLLPNQGGGSPRVNKNQTSSLQMCFFQWACRIIVGPPKHVLHLVWSAYVFFTAIGTALKIALGSQIMGKRRPVL